MEAREAAVAGIGRTAFSKSSGRTPLAIRPCPPSRTWCPTSSPWWSSTRGPRLPGIRLGERGPGVEVGQRVRAELTAFPGAAERAITIRRDGAEAG